MPATARFADVPTASGGITRLALGRLREHAVNLTPLLRRAGLSASEVNDPEARLTPSQLLHGREHHLMQADLAHYPPCLDPYGGFVTRSTGARA